MKKVVGMLLIGILFLAAGCNVYHSGSASINEAVDSEARVRIVTTDNVFYEFKKLKRENGNLVGVTARNSDAARALSQYQQLPDGKNVKIILPQNEIQAVYLKDRKMSNLVNVGVPVVGAAGIIGLTSDGFRPDVGN